MIRPDKGQLTLVEAARLALAAKAGRALRLRRRGNGIT